MFPIFPLLSLYFDGLLTLVMSSLMPTPFALWGQKLPQDNTRDKMLLLSFQISTVYSCFNIFYFYCITLVYRCCH